ncbi:hypothetical protein [Phaeovulum sp. W22_SRMD_FR3]|uniref:hypothetical protein n=1 Tax=Phaeovulum sp. W22_SRMD_FR3 TaxID=3240274 RepID=UPI003F99BF62
MQQPQRFAMMGATLVLALASGQLVQSIGPRAAPQPPAANPANWRDADMSAVVNITPTAGKQTPSLGEAARLPALSLRLPVADSGIVHAPSDAERHFDEYGRLCAAPVLLLQAAADAMMQLTLDAPCMGQMPVLLHHAGMDLALRTDAAGRAQMLLPALASPASVSADLPDGSQISAGVTVPGLDAVNRVAISGPGTFIFNAAEATTAFGGAPQLQGKLMLLGEDLGPDYPMVQLYSGPAATTDVSFTLEVPVTEEACNSDLALSSLRMQRGGAVEAMPIEIALPDCAAVGEAVLLPLPDLTSAKLSMALADTPAN